MADPITTALIGHTLRAIADEMAGALERSAYSPMIRDVRDYCAALVDVDGTVLTYNSGGLPTHYSDIGEHIMDGIDIYGMESFRRGDAVMMNHVYSCGQHANNVAVYTPIVVDGDVVAFAATRAHWSDIGGITANRPTYGSTDAIQEGLQVRSIKVYREGEPDETVLRLIRHNLRRPDVSLGDLRAQIAACRVGERRFEELLGTYALDEIGTAVRATWDQSERIARAAVEAIPDGSYEASAWLDDDGYEPERPVEIRVRVEVSGSDMTIDFTDLADQVMGPINSRSVAPAFIAFKALTTPRLPPDAGCFRPLTLIIPDGKLISARPPAAMGSWSWPFPTIIDVIFRALAEAVPGQVAAGNAGTPYGAGFFYGADPRTGASFMNSSLLPVGWGGRPSEDGVTSGGMTLGYVRDWPVEVTESTAPLIVEKVALRPDSAGPGTFRGGLGVEYVFRCLADMLNNTEVGRIRCPAWGLFEGAQGSPGVNTLELPDGTVEEIRFGGINRRLPPGARLTVRTGGGGGYGPPLERDPEAVAADVRDGYVSREAAERDYGVVLDAGNGAVDAERTAAMRDGRAVKS